MRPVLLLPLLAMLAACGSDSEAPAPVPPEADSENARARLAGLPEGQRNAVFIRAIRDARGDCQGVESSQSVGAAGGEEVWLATCSGGRRWTIQVAEDGSAAVTPVDDSGTAQ